MTDTVSPMDRAALRQYLEWFCGCGSPRSAAASLLMLLRLAPWYQPENRKRIEAWIPHTGVRMLLFYLLDEHHLIEHGTTIEGSWLTPTGEAVRDALERESADQFAALLDADYCSHGYDVDDRSHSCHDGAKP